jgi:hypothetical protein
MTRQTLGDFSRFFVHRDTSWAPLKQTRSSAERALLDEKAAAAGVTLSQLIRSAVLGHQLPSPPIVREAMSELHRVSVNLNQLTRRRRQYDRRHAPSPSCAPSGACSKPPCATPSIYDPARAEGMVSMWMRSSSCNSSNPAAPVFALMRRAITMASASFSQAKPWISNTLKVQSK